ncbi:hypothetical protein OG883_38195 [Streptomyces sp. NBC_01142]|uniref:hypothetical protein n=1 Tax=Streptomyces sp. NBC_01142 TaxID=2975865 RepID=UPI00225675C7|nr:hypothetical protein [Streptomyces sp. NBC_01142]MCX4825585.1 hypothetical protein [Streptomyces sp. NBC_01142]
MTAGSTTGYDHRGAHLLALLLAGGAPGDGGRIRRRLGEKEPAYLTWVPLSAEARANAARDPDPFVRRPLAAADGLTADDLAALLEPSDPVVDQRVYAHAEARPWMRRLILVPGRHTEPGALAPLLERIHASQAEPPGLDRFIGAGVVSGVPEVVEHALRTCGSALTSAEQLRGVLGLFAHPERLRALLDGAGGPTPLRPAVAELARAALDGNDNDREALRAAVATAEGADGLVAGVRAGEAEPVWRRTPDWDALLAAHRAEPLPEPAVRALAARPDCPGPVLAELYRTHPGAVADVSRPCPALLRAAVETPGHPELIRIASASGPVEDALCALVLDSVAPARIAAATLVELGPAEPLRALLHLRLGADPGRWAALRASLSRYKGTLAALLAAIADGTAPAGPAKPPALTKPYRFLLYAAKPADLSGLLPHLPDELLKALLGKGALPPHALGTALAAADPRVAAAVAGNVALGIRDLRRLTELDEPAVNAAVLRNQKATLSLRRAIVSGIPRTPGRIEPLPLDAGLRAELLGDTYQHLRTPLVTSGDPELVQHAWQFLSENARHYAVVRIWERRGPQAVRRLLDLLPHAHALPVLVRAAAALEHPDGPDQLREGLEPFDDPDTLPRIFAESRGRNATRRLMYTIVHEPYAYDFARLVAAHRQTPFQPEPVAELLRHEDVDEAVRHALTLAEVNLSLPSGTEDLSAEPVELLRAAPYVREQCRWFARAAGNGLIAPERLVDTAHPAREVLAGLRNLDEDTAAAARSHAVGLVREHLAGHPEAWAVALRLLDTFAGTLAELIVVAAQVAGPGPGADELARQDARELARLEPQSDAVEAPAPAPALTPGEERRVHKELESTAALAAAHLLRSLAPGAPVPTDPGVLDVLARTHAVFVPGLTHPEWLADACAAHGSSGTVERLTARSEDRKPLSGMDTYRHGNVAPSEMVARQPAREMNPLPKGWRAHSSAEPQLRAARDLVADRLGTDTGRWLRALAAMNNGWAERDFAEVLDQGDVGSDATVFTPLGARLLLHADVAALTAVLPRLGAGAAVALTEHACASGYLPDALLDHLFASDDRAALLALIRSSYGTRRDRELQLRLLDLDDPTINAALYGSIYTGASVEIRRIILSRRPRSRTPQGPDDLVPLAPELRERLTESTYYSKDYAHCRRVQLEAADPDLVEHALSSWGKRRPLLDHLLAARGSLRHGGPGRLRSLIDRNLLSSGAAKVAAKALDTDDPDAVLTARLDRELGTDRLVAKLRACKEYEDELRVLELPYARDWDVLIAAHDREPFPPAVWTALGGLPDAPDEVAAAGLNRWFHLRERALIGRSPRCARAAVAVRDREENRVRRADNFDFLVERGLLTGSDLIHHAAGANGVLHYLAEAALRRELSAPVRTAVQEATEEVADLAAKLLGTGEQAWQRLFAAMTGRDIHWLLPGCRTTVAALIEHSARTPL